MLNGMYYGLTRPGGILTLTVKVTCFFSLWEKATNHDLEFHYPGNSLFG